MTGEDKFKEECGVFGIYAEDRDNIHMGLAIYAGLSSLQHRGEESCGVAYINANRINIYKNIGKVSEVFNERFLSEIKGNVAIGHVRYSTCGKPSISSAQPFLEKVNSKSFAVVHNGNITNADEIKKSLNGQYFKSNSDSEVIGKFIKANLHLGIEKAVIKLVEKLRGSYSVLILLDKELIVLRDPMGIRPLCIGKLGESYIACSESCALNCLGAKFLRDVKPGELIIINQKGMKSTMVSNNCKLCTCAFEYVYFSREDSIIDDIYVNAFREETGKLLFRQYPAKCDVVIGIPDSAIPYALGYAKEASIPYERAIVRNKYICRTFIVDNNRENLLRLKFSVLKEKVYNKKVVVVDDSLVRGNTMKVIVKALRETGAKEVHIRIASPKIKYTCPYGINIKTSKELIENNFSGEEIKKYIGADSLEYLSFKRFKSELKHNGGFCTGCFTGKYSAV